MQSYLHAAKLAPARVHHIIGNYARAIDLESEARLQNERFNKEFWMPNEQYYAVALHGNKERVNSIASNPGHCLWSVIVENGKLRHVVKRLLGEDMFNGWGIRTLSSQIARYNPLSYHNGSVWTHDNSIIASGMLRYDFYTEAINLAVSIVEAATSFPDYRLPELFIGYIKREGSAPVPYPAANSPQAWSSGALIYCLETLLGLAESGESLTQIAHPEGNTISMSGIVYMGRRLEL